MWEETYLFIRSIGGHTRWVFELARLQLRLTAIVGRFRDFVGDETQKFTLNSFHEVRAISMIWIANGRAMSETRADQNGVENFEAPLFVGSRLYRGLNCGSWSWCRYMVKVSRRIYELLAIKIVVNNRRRSLQLCV